MAGSVSVYFTDNLGAPPLVLNNVEEGMEDNSVWSVSIFCSPKPQLSSPTPPYVPICKLVLI